MGGIQHLNNSTCLFEIQRIAFADAVLSQASTQD
jgi:hypothetical protein